MKRLRAIVRRLVAPQERDRKRPVSLPARVLERVVTFVFPVNRSGNSVSRS